MGRIALPLAAWLLAGGRPELVQWTLPIVVVASFAGLALVVGRSGGNASAAAFPTMLLAAGMLGSEPLATLLLAGALLAWSSGSRRSALVLAALCPLAKEIIAVGLLPAVAADARRGRLAGWVAAVTPTLA